jgi:hypothetical protein
MSAFLGFVTGGSRFPQVLGLYVGINDDVLQPVSYRSTLPGQRVGRRQDVDVLWPRSGLLGRTDTANCAPIWDAMRQVWEWNFQPSGTAGPRIISGIVRDATGVVVSGATVQLFNSATGLLVDSATTDAGGNYQMNDPNLVSCFVVAYKTGSPDTFGTTLNTLTS